MAGGGAASCYASPHRSADPLPVTLADFLLAYLAIGASLSAFALVRTLLSGPSMDHLRHEACALACRWL